MNTTELLAALRYEVFIGDATTFPDYDDARLLVELSDELRTTFSRAVTQARSGYWLKQKFATVAASATKCPIPRRAVIGGLENLSVADDGSGKYFKLAEVSETHAQSYELASGGIGEVQKYVVRADQVVLLPAPARAYTLRLSYYVRPSRLVLAQPIGVITAFNPTARTITVNDIPANQDTGLTLVNGAIIDVVHPTGWCELALVGAPVTGLAVKTFTIGGTDPMDEIVVGDYVRAADQTDWPCLPEDFHRTLAKSAAVKVMGELHMLQKASATAAQVNADLQRFSDLLVSRIKSEAKVLKAPRSVLAVGRAGWR